MEKKGVHTKLMDDESLKKSTDYIELMRLLSSGSRIEATNLHLVKVESAKITFREPSVPQMLESSEADVIDFCIHAMQTIDPMGDRVFGLVRDAGQYYADLSQFSTADDRESFNAAKQRIESGSVKIDYVPADLIKEFLNSPTRFGDKFLPLKEQYYELRVLSLAHAQDILNTYKQARAQSAENERLCDALMDIMKVFTRNKNTLKNYLQFMNSCDFDTGYVISQLKLPLDQLKHKREMLAKAGGMPSEVGLQYILEEYATFSESVIRFLNVIRFAIELVDGNADPEPKLDSIKNWQIVKAHPKYGFIVDKFDPRIRNAKAHNHICISQGNITIGADKNGKAEKVAEYDWKQLRDMWQNLFKLVSVLSISIYMSELALVGVILNSGDYKLMLVGVGNIKRLV
jgi:hypothetical protein